MDFPDLLELTRRKDTAENSPQEGKAGSRQSFSTGCLYVCGSFCPAVLFNVFGEELFPEGHFPAGSGFGDLLLTEIGGQDTDRSADLPAADLGGLEQEGGCSGTVHIEEFPFAGQLFRPFGFDHGIGIIHGGCPETETDREIAHDGAQDPGPGGPHDQVDSAGGPYIGDPLQGRQDVVTALRDQTARFADDQPLEEEITFRIDIYARENLLYPINAALHKTMRRNGYQRYGQVQDDYLQDMDIYVKSATYTIKEQLPFSWE